jgi:hypothetical protein
MSRKNIVFIGIGAVLLVSLYVGGWIWYLKERQGRQIHERRQEMQGQSEDQEKVYEVHGVLDVSGWKTYRNEDYGFEMKYPEDVNWKLNEDEDSSGQMVFVSLVKDEALVRRDPSTANVAVHCLKSINDEMHAIVRQVQYKNLKDFFSENPEAIEMRSVGLFSVSGMQGYFAVVGGQSWYFSSAFEKHNGNVCFIDFQRSYPKFEDHVEDFSIQKSMDPNKSLPSEELTILSTFRFFK